MALAATTDDTVETKSAFAKRLGMSRQAMQKHASTVGFPVDDAGKVRVKAALDWMELNIRGHGGADEITSDGGLIGARIALIKVQTARAEIALSHDRQESIPYVEARRALAAFMRLNRDVFLNFPLRYGPAIAAEVGCDEATLISALSVEVRNALNEALDNPPPFEAN